MVKQQLIEERAEIARSGIFTVREIQRLGFIAYLVGSRKLNGDMMRDAPPQVTVIQSMSGRMHLLDDTSTYTIEAEEGGAAFTTRATFCRRRERDQDDFEERVTWEQAVRDVSCPGCRARGIDPRLVVWR